MKKRDVFLPGRARSSVATIAAALALAGLVAGCGDKKKENDAAATQTAAKVNKEEVTVHQINHVLSQQRAAPPEQAASTNRLVLERLIDQELVVQKAGEQKIDRDPRVLQQIEAARRDIISRAYMEKLGEGAAKPTEAEVVAYYQSHPALFSARRVFSLQEVLVQAPPEQIESLKTVLAQSKTFADFVAYLKSNSIKFAGSEAVRTAEQLPMEQLQKFADMKDGQTVFNVRQGGAQVLHLVQSRQQPVSEQQAKGAIEKFIVNERKRKLIADDLQALRGAAKVEYVGQFAAEAARSPYVPPTVGEVAPVKTLAPTLPAPTVDAAPQVDVARPEQAPASMPSGDVLDKGLKGLN